jgi:methionyl-tRNA formyltransferase
MNYCVCASADYGYTVLKTLFEKGLDIVCILTNKKSPDIIELAEKNNTPYFAGNPREGKAFEWIKQNGFEFDNILSVNYLFILEGDVLSLAKKNAVNIHGSLLPRYRGRTPTVWSVINGEKEIGVTAHLMNEQCDDGDIIRQEVLTIGPDETAGMVDDRFFEMYPSFVWKVVQDVESGNFPRIKQDPKLATYFGRRTPDMGEINWDWQKERIHNWVRAQAQPWFPGAFTYCNGEKVIINKITYSTLGFIYDMPNGLVVSIEDGHPMVKTPNGIIRLEEFVSSVEIKEADVLIGKLTDVERLAGVK